jgi:hypothetical protein
MSQNGGKVVQRLWFALCGFECCSFVLVSAINGLTATIYWKLMTWQNTIHVSIRENAARTVLAALLIGVFASLASIARLLCWRWAGKNEARLQRFVIAVVLGNAALAFVILGLLFRAFCIAPDFCSGREYHSIAYLQVRSYETCLWNRD